MTRHAGIAQLTCITAIGVHDPHFQSAALVRLVRNEYAVGGKERVHVHAGIRSQPPQCPTDDIYFPNVWGPGTRREENNVLFVRRPVRLKVATVSGGTLACV